MMSNTRQAELNAVAFEMSVDAPGWYSGLLVACSVERRQGSRTTSSRTVTKLPLGAFAKASHQRTEFVAAYLDAWESAADDGQVPHADELTPQDALAGLEFAPEVHTAEAWSLMVDALLEGTRARDRAYDAKRNVYRGIEPPEPTKEQVAVTIEKDPGAEQAARETIDRIDAKRTLERAQRKDRAQTQADYYSPRPSPVADQLVDVAVHYRKAKGALQEMLGGVTRAELGDESRSIVVGMVEELRNYLLAIEQASAGHGLEAELAELLKES